MQYVPFMVGLTMAAVFVAIVKLRPPKNPVQAGVYGAVFICTFVIVMMFTNAFSNRYLNHVKAPIWPQEEIKQEVPAVLPNKHLQPQMNAMERQERTDTLIDRRQITDKLYGEK